MTRVNSKWRTGKIVFNIILYAAVVVALITWKDIILNVLKNVLVSNITDVVCLLLIILLLIHHYFNNQNEPVGTVSSKEGLENGIDYLFFGSRVLALLYGIKVLLIVCFFPDAFGCTDSLTSIKFIVLITVFIIGLYTFGALKPVVEDIYKDKVTIEQKDSPE